MSGLLLTTVTLISMSSALEQVVDADIDSEGRFKYILINVSDGSNSKMIVRGYSWACFHGDIFDKVEENLMKNRLKCECVGGGRIVHEPSKKKIFVFGYSQGFGRADHQTSVDILKKAFPSYDDINWSNDGY